MYGGRKLGKMDRKHFGGSLEKYYSKKFKSFVGIQKFILQKYTGRYMYI